MQLILLIVCLLILIGIIGILFTQLSAKRNSAAFQEKASAALLQESSRQLHEELIRLQESLIRSTQSSVKDLSGILGENQKSIGEMQSQRISELNRTVAERLESIRTDNSEKLESMRAMVDEKLQKTLETKMTESFRLVNDRLEQVYKGLGEMQTLAAGVGDLKKVLSNVKTRGILGEIQLGAILEEILAPEQYETNVATVPGSKNVVEYAIKLPGDNGSFVYLPIDAKFPADAYQKLQDAYESGKPELVSSAASDLNARIKSFAKDIRTKYVEVPYTTDFAILFLPFEGLYAEAVNRGLVETLQRDFRINLAGPSTMAALLNSLQMGFRTLALQKRSAEVWEILGAVKTEFDKFADILENTQKKLNQANSELDKLVGTRTNVIRRKLRDVEKLEETKAQNLLEE